MRTRARVPSSLDLVWRRTTQDACQLHEFAGRGDELERAAVIEALMREQGAEVLSLEDPATGAVRRAVFRAGRLEQVLFLTVSGRLPPRDWLASLFTEDEVSAGDRGTLLAGLSAAPRPDPGALVCACLKVGTRIIAAAAQAGAQTIDAIGAATGAGTNCGSCRPEIARLIAAHAKEKTHAAAA